MGLELNKGLKAISIFTPARKKELLAFCREYLEELLTLLLQYLPLKIRL